MGGKIFVWSGGALATFSIEKWLWWWVIICNCLQSDYNDNKCDRENKQYVHHQVLYLATRFLHRNTFDDIEHQQKVEISYKVFGHS
jgi:hypothetical protein